MFDLDRSSSGFPVFLDESFSIGKAYHLLQKPANWKAGGARLYLGTRKKNLSVQSYRSKLHLKAQNLQKNPGLVDGAVLFASKDWMLYWQHSTSAKITIPNFSDITNPVLDRNAECEEIPVDFTFRPSDFSAVPGTFFNFQFPVVD